MVAGEAFQLFSLGVILVCVLVFSLIGRRFGVPALLGSIFIGILLGQSGIGFITAVPEWLSFLATIGGMLILFLIGMETDVRELFTISKKALAITGLGVFFPAIYVLIASILFGFTKSQMLLMMAAAVVTATPTSLAIIMVLKKTHTKAAQYLHASTIMDNIIGIFFVFMLIAVYDVGIGGGVRIEGLVMAAILLVVLLALSYSTMPRVTRWIFNRFGHPSPQTRITIAFSFVLFFGAITSNFLFEAALGAFLAGVMLSEIKTEYKTELIRTIRDVGEGLFFPLFFLTIGLAVNIGSLAGSSLLLVFLLVYTVIAIFGKFIGGYYGSLVSKLNKNEALAIGAGLIPRGGIGLIIAQIGLTLKQTGTNLPILSEAQFASIVLMVFFTTIIGVVLIYKYFGKLR